MNELKQTNMNTQACKGALRKLAHLYRSKALVELFEGKKKREEKRSKK